MRDRASEAPSGALREDPMGRLGLVYAFVPGFVMPCVILLGPTDKSVWLIVGYMVSAVILERVLPESPIARAPTKPVLSDVWLYLFVVMLWTFTVLVALLVRARHSEPMLTALQRIYRACGVQLHPSGVDFGTLGAVLALFFGLNTNVAHDLIHRNGAAAKRTLGFVLLSLCGDGQLAVSHIRGHHVHTGMQCDPASARAGESLYAFFVRSTVGQHRESWQFEAERLADLRVGSLSLRNRVVVAWLLNLGMAAALGMIGGGMMLLLYAIGCLGAKFLFETANYVQHYGLVRVAGERCAARHSWDSAAAYSRTFMFNQNRHAHHHARAGLTHWQLELMAESPKLPYGYITMFLIAMVPAFWRAVMEPRRREWLRTQASAAERAAAGVSS